MTQFPPLRDSAYERYWDDQKGLAVSFWQSREDAAEVRALIARWIVAKAEHPTTRAPGGLVPEARAELPALLEGPSGDLAPRFASLTRGGEDDPYAEWMLALAAADAIAIETGPAVLTVALDLAYGPLGHLALDSQLRRAISADPDLARRFGSLAATLVAERIQDPAGAVLRSQRDRFEDQLVSWRRDANLRDLLREPAFEVGFSDGPERFALAVLRGCDPTGYVDLLAQLDVPQLVADIFAELHDDAEAIAEVLAAAPVAFEEGRWNRSLVAPLALRTAFIHLTTRLVRSPELDEAGLSDLAKATCGLFVAAIARREDGPWLSLRWSIALLEELALRSRDTGTPPPLRSPAGAPWLLLERLSDAPPALWRGSAELADLAPELSLLLLCARILATMGQGPVDPLDLDAMVPADTSDERALMAAEKFLRLAPDPASYLYDLLGWELARHPYPAERWASLWQLALPFRDKERHRYGAKLERSDDGSVAKIVWGTGLHATFWLRSEHRFPAEPGEVAALTAMLSNAALEQRLTRYVDEPFWDAASAHAVVATAGAVQAGAAPAKHLADAIRNRVGVTPEFFRILHSLLKSGVSVDDICEGIPSGLIGLRTLIDDAVAIGALEHQFARQTDAAVRAVMEALGPEPRL